MKKKFGAVIAAMLTLAFSAPSHGSTNGFEVPTIRSLAGSAFAGWESFTYGSGTNNRPDLAGSTRDAAFSQTDTNGFITGSGNIYNFATASSFKVSYASRVPVAQVVFQARSVGAELDYNSTKIVFVQNGVRQSIATSRTEVRGADGSVASKWGWDLTSSNVTAFNIEFAAAGPSLSFDSATLDVSKETIHVTQSRVDLDRWMYPNNATPGTRPSASVFSVFGEDGATMDTRWAQFFLGWNTATNAAFAIPTGKGAAQYLIQMARVGLTVNRDRVWAYDGTHDGFETYLTEADARHVADADAGRPVELFGAGFRGGFTAATFPETGPFGSEGIQTRNAYAAGYDASGAFVDVSNNVGKQDAAAFEAKPFGVGVAADLAAGDLVPTGTHLTFALDLSDAKIAGYLQSGLDSGIIRLVASALVNASFSSPNYPQFYTRDNTLAAANEIALLNMDVQIANPEPTLQISKGTEGKVHLSWASPDGENYQVETAGTAAATTLWLPVAGSPVTLNGVTSIQFDASQSLGFFRLHRVL